MFDLTSSCDPPSVALWTKAMREAPADVVLGMRQHAIRCLHHDNPNWSLLLTLGEKILRERSISF